MFGKDGAEWRPLGRAGLGEGCKPFRTSQLSWKLSPATNHVYMPCVLTMFTCVWSSNYNVYMLAFSSFLTLHPMEVGKCGQPLALFCIQNKLQTHLILLHFTLLHFTDVALFTN